MFSGDAAIIGMSDLMATFFWKNHLIKYGSTPPISWLWLLDTAKTDSQYCGAGWCSRASWSSAIVEALFCEYGDGGREVGK